MNNKSEKLKSLIKGAKPTFGTDPNDPWSTKAGITEENLSEDELLDRYMRTRGINPKTASKISKIAASKTGDFNKWKMQHVSGGRLPVIKKEEIDPGLTDVKGTVGATKRRIQQLKTRKSLHKVVKTPGLHKEDVYQDPLSATQTVFDGANNTNDTAYRTYKLIKKIQDRKINEELYDHEKEDKSVKTYGKKPNHEKSDKKDNVGEKKPQAAAVLSGGTTLTGQKRDDIEIDPLMRVRPGQPDPTKDKDKDKDKKKQDNKKDK
jgi:hypothetical protein